ncbi:MAG: alpha/beta fold hydrolase [Ktedonobacterales bacterium]
MATGKRQRLATWQMAALAAAGGAGLLAAANWLAARGAGAATSPLDGDRGRYAWAHGDIAYTVKGTGDPLVLVHGVYVGASSYEFRHVFDLLAREFRVYALDLLGFGLSARPPVVYTPVLYEELIQDFLLQVVGAGDHPASVVASSLAAAFTIRAAAERPGLFTRLVLIEPTGIENLADAHASLGRTLALDVLRSPLLGQGIYNVIASRPSLRYYLKAQIYDDPALVSDDVIDTYYTMAHQPGARFAPASFLAGLLNTPVSTVFPLLKQPILLCWGKDARFTPLETAGAFRQANARAELRVFDCGGLPQAERPGELGREVSQWLRAGRTSAWRG